MGGRAIDEKWQSRNLENWSQTVPLSHFQKELLKVLCKNRTEDSHLAGGSALHFEADSIRYSEDLDFFHDSDIRVASAFAEDQSLLLDKKYKVNVEIRQPGYIRALVTKADGATKVEWAQDSSWRFMPVDYIEDVGYVLHKIDLVINKLLALAGRDEARDYLDVLYTHENILSLGAQVWAACGKDPGLSPQSLLELLKRRGKYHPEDFDRLHLTQNVDLKDLKKRWLAAIQKAEIFIAKAPTKDLGCLYFSKSKNQFVSPDFESESADIVVHFGKKAGILPILK